MTTGGVGGRGSVTRPKSEGGGTGRGLRYEGPYSPGGTVTGLGGRDGVRSGECSVTRTSIRRPTRTKPSRPGPSRRTRPVSGDHPRVRPGTLSGGSRPEVWRRTPSDVQGAGPSADRVLATVPIPGEPLGSTRVEGLPSGLRIMDPDLVGPSRDCPTPTPVSHRVPTVGDGRRPPPTGA